MDSGPKAGRAALVCLSLLLGAVVEGAAAQEGLRLREGDRIRVQIAPSAASSGSLTHVGDFQSLRSGALVLQENHWAGPRIFALEEIDRLERSLGRPYPAGAAMLLGGGIGGVAAWNSGLGLGAGPVGLALGVVLGGVVGVVLDRERWERLTLVGRPPPS